MINSFISFYSIPTQNNVIFSILNFFSPVSDRCFAGEADDKSGSTIESIIKSGKFVDNAEISLRDCVPDEVSIIRVNLMSLLSNIIRMKSKCYFHFCFRINSYNGAMKITLT